MESSRFSRLARLGLAILLAAGCLFAQESREAGWQPPWRNSWPFQAACVVTVCLVAWTIHRARVAGIVRRLNLRFEERLDERTRVAGELHDTLLQGFLSASMQLDVAMERLPADSPVRPQLARILELMNRVGNEGRNAVQGLRTRDGDSMCLEQAFASIEQEFDSAGGPRLQIAVEGRSRPLRPVFRDEVYRIGREAIINAFRHSGAGMINVAVEYDDHGFCLLVCDDGNGIAPECLGKSQGDHLGISGMRDRAEQMGARLRVWSRPHAGTRVELSAPGNIAFRCPQPNPTRSSSWLAAIGRF